MTDPLLRQGTKRLGLRAPVTTFELARRLQQGPTAALVGLLEDVRRSYAEAERARQRLGHALRLSSDELFETNQDLVRRAGEVEALQEIHLAAQAGADVRELILTALTAACSALKWPLAHAWVRPDQDLDPAESRGWHAWHTDRAQLATCPVAEQTAFREFAAEASAEGSELAGWRPALDGGHEPAWFGSRPAAGSPADTGSAAAISRYQPGGIAIPVVVDGEVGLLLEFFAPEATRADAAILGFGRRLASQLGQVLANRTAACEREVLLGLLEATHESTPDGVLIVDLNSQVLKANARFVEMWRLPPAVMASGHQAERLALISQQVVDPEALVTRIRTLAADHEAVARDEIELLDGRVFERTTQPIRTAGKVAGRIFVFRDVTAERRALDEHKHLEEQFRQSQKMEAVGRLAGGVAHDFNNLLSIIIGYSEMLELQLDGASSQARLTAEIRKAGNRAAKLTQQLLAFSRKQVLAPVEVDLNATVRAMAAMAERLIGEDIELITCLAPELGKVMADPGQLDQVILNLVVNGRDAMPGGGKLWIETANRRIERPTIQRPIPPGEYVVLTVRDNGCGMSDEVRGRIFEPFFTTKETGKGTGLGLSTVYGIVQQSGAHIEVESAPGRGSAFIVYFEPSALHAPTVPLPTELESRARGSETILLIEDDAAVRGLVREILQAHGYRVIESNGYVEAERLVAESRQPIHVMLTDVIMPGMYGPQLFERLTRSRPELRVVYMSGYTADAISHHGVLDPGTIFLGKPFTAAQLTNRIREALAAPAAIAVATP